ncbi:MAG: hypothetical protein EA424_15300, partial [Planctomycetaceae bacterium]
MHRELSDGSPAEKVERSVVPVGRSRRWWLHQSLAAAAGFAVWPFLPAARAGFWRLPVPSRRELASEIEQTLWKQILPAWYPRSLDIEHGGFWEHFAEDWSRRPTTTKF